VRYCRHQCPDGKDKKYTNRAKCSDAVTLFREQLTLDANHLSVVEFIRRRFENRGLVCDRYPVWEHQGRSLFFLSNRCHHGGPWWNRKCCLAHCDLGQEGARYLEPGWSNTPNIGSLTLASQGTSLVYSDNEHLCHVINLHSGAHQFLGGEEEPFEEMDIRHDRVACAARRRHGEGKDIHIGEIAESGKPSYGTRVERMTGDETLPVLSPDAETVYFVHTDAELPAGADIYSVSASLPVQQRNPQKTCDQFSKKLNA